MIIGIKLLETIIQTLILDQVNKFVKDTITGIFAPKVPAMKVPGVPNPHKAGGGTVQASASGVLCALYPATICEEIQSSTHYCGT